MLAQPALQIKAHEPDAPVELEFSVLATAPASRPRRALKHGDTFIVTDNFGDIGATAGGTDGLYHADTRFLSHLELSLNGSQPLLLGSNARDDNTLLAVDLTNPDYYDGAGAQIVLQKDIVHIARTMFLWNGSAYQRFAVRNHGDRPLVLQIVLHFDSDFADLFEVRGLQRPRRGTVSRSVIGPDQALLSYLGLDNVTRRTLLTFHPAPSEISPSKVSYRLVLAPGESKPDFPGGDLQRGARLSAGAVSARIAGGPSRTACTIARGLHGRDLERAVQRNPLPLGRRPRDAGDRDAARRLIRMPVSPGTRPHSAATGSSRRCRCCGAIRVWRAACCAGSRRFQAKTTDPASDAEPGKILHEMRSGEMAALGEVPFGLYYGSVDSTPLFVLLAGLYVERTDDEETLRELWPAI